MRVFISHASRDEAKVTALASSLRERGIDVTLFSFTPLPSELGEVLSYGIDEDELGRHWSRRVILVTDADHLLVGAAEGSRLDRAVVSEELALIEMAVANLVLDITLFGERRGVDTARVVERLTDKLAPIEALLPK